MSDPNFYRKHDAETGLFNITLYLRAKLCEAGHVHRERQRALAEAQK